MVCWATLLLSPGNVVSRHLPRYIIIIIAGYLLPDCLTVHVLWLISCEYVIILRLAFHVAIRSEDSPSPIARRWSTSVLGSVAQPDACGLEPHQAVAVPVSSAAS